MARIYDNIESKFMQGLQDIITNIGVKRVDFCVGYFNLRGWELVVNHIDQIPGDYVYENNKQEFRCCRLLIGMHQPDKELVKRLYSKPQLPDANYVQQCKLEIAREFRQQLLLGNPTKKDEWTLRRLSAQLKDHKVCVKLYVAEPLHAKLYLAHRPDDNLNKISAILGSSNLTYSGLTKQGELDADIENHRDLEALAEWFDENINEDFSNVKNQITKLLNEEDELQKIAKVVGKDVLSDLKKLVLEICKCIRVGFLQQNSFNEIDTSVPLEKQFKMMDLIVFMYNESLELIEKGIPLSEIKKLGFFERYLKLKYEINNKEIQKFDSVKHEFENEFKKLENEYEGHIE